MSNVWYKGHLIDELFAPEEKEEKKPVPSFFPTNKELGIVMSENAGNVPPIPSLGGKE